MWKFVNFVAAILAGVGTVTMAFIDMKTDKPSRVANDETEPEEDTEENEDEEEES